MRDEITRLRRAMTKEGISVWISPTSDAHQSEYVSEHDKCRAYLSGFTGSAGILVVTGTQAKLWTDGRYFVQAEMELDGSGIELMRQGDDDVPTITEYLSCILEQGDVLGFDGRVINATYGDELYMTAASVGASVRYDIDLMDDVWPNRPEVSHNPVWVLDKNYTGEDASDRLRIIRSDMRDRGGDTLLLSALDDIAWLSCLRGSDIECNPLFMSYMIVSEEECILFMNHDQQDALHDYISQHGITVRDYDEWEDAVQNLHSRKILLDKRQTSYETHKSIDGTNDILDVMSPVMIRKCIKTEAEIAHMKECHIRDGIYMTRYIIWLKDAMKSGKHLTEVEASDYLDALRRADDMFVELSFPTISAYGDDAAIVHYEAEPESAATLRPFGMYLVDSGAHYLDGTTDVTRTIALGDTKGSEKKSYTLVTVGMLRLLYARWAAGARGTNLDTFARSVLWKNGMNFNHGTGHGVGYCNTVHESPVAIRTSQSKNLDMNVVFEPGMICSDEPGYYLEGDYGIRTENLLLCVRDEEDDGYLRFTSLTQVPLDSDCIDMTYMTVDDIDMYNRYQSGVYEALSPYMTEEEKNRLREMTHELNKKA